MIIDTHVHYNLEPIFPDWKIYWNEAQHNDIQKSIVIGTNEETNLRAIDIAEHNDHLYATIGIHPHESLDESALSLSFSQLEHQCKQSKKIVAIGECGLDFFRLTPENAEIEKKKQLILFQKHIELAQHYNLPLVIHCREAQREVIETLSLLKVHHFVLHCMSGTLEYLRQAVALGGYISFAGNITYKNADALRELAKQTPQDRILVETDAPYLPPQSHRGQLNNPRYIAETVQSLAEVLGMSDDACRMITTQNAERCFSI